MKYNLEDKKDLHQFFMSKNVSPVIKGKFGRKSAKNKAKREAAMKAKQINRQKQILRNREFFNIPSSVANNEHMYECHSTANFTKENNKIIPKLKLYRKYRLMIHNII